MSAKRKTEVYAISAWEVGPSTQGGKCKYCSCYLPRGTLGDLSGDHLASCPRFGKCKYCSCVLPRCSMGDLSGDHHSTCPRFDGDISISSSTSASLFHKIPLSDIRHLAAQSGWTEICINEPSRVISFFNDDESIRINVYYSTMTVSTALNHPLTGKSQLFRRNITKAELQELFGDPRHHTGKGYYKKQRVSDTSTREKFKISDSYIASEEDSLKDHIKDLEAQLQAARNALLDYLLVEEERKQQEKKIKAARDLELQRITQEEERRRVAAAEAAQRRAHEVKKEEKRRLAGKYCDWELSSSDCFPSEMFDDTNEENNISCVAIGGGGYVSVHRNGRKSYHGIPNNVVKQIENPNTLIDYISIGPDDQYFVRKKNGKEVFVIPSALQQEINKRECTITFVALGPFGTYYAKFEDGSSIWAGDISHTAQQLFCSNVNIDSVWLGRNGAYFVGYTNSGVYRTSYQKLPHNVAKRHCCNGREQVRLVLCDENHDTCFVRYN